MCTSENQLHSFLDTLARQGQYALKPSHPDGTIDDNYDTVDGKEIIKCVVKPVQSAGTDDVFLCSRREEAAAAFKRINGKVSLLGIVRNHRRVIVLRFPPSDKWTWLKK
jgi:hypothetical protein